MTTDELREKYLEFFESKGCVRRPSDVLVPRWDPSVLFTPAGMNQFKDHFLGRCPLEFTRATTCQKCLRTGDIENVGRTAYHHTFFEMLGNFSFGDYFKRDAIHWAWEFLTSKQWLAMPADKLSVTVYLDDDEAAAIWTDEIKLPVHRVKRMGEDDNFWPASAPTQGPDGVCGPCSEIYFRTPVGEVEIWNLVFTQFDRQGGPPNNLFPLPSKNIDTGMGLERAAAVIQGVDTNYHIDSLRPIVEAAAETCRVAYDPASDNGRRLRRITDHVRACTFAIHENVDPGPKEQGYVIRRLLRRAVLDGHQMGVREPFLYRLVESVVEQMRRPYPELAETHQRVATTIRDEEARFLRTIDAGLDRVERMFRQMRQQNREQVAGGDAFEMYATHGFPPELLEALAAEHNLSFDWPGYRREMESHSEVSNARGQVELFKSGPLDSLKKARGGNEFLGYHTIEADAEVIGIVAQDQLCDQVDEIGHERPIVVVLDRTPFYGESGGQVGDIGSLEALGLRFEVTDTVRDGGFMLHVGHLREGVLRAGMKVTARVDGARRQAIRRAHSATHVLHFALQKHLGSHAQQKGSKVDADWLRFDFSHPQAVGREELRRIEEEVNARIMECDPVTWTTLPIAEARRVGAMMLFGEKYPDVVRMVSMGGFSRELCGGTHLDNTGQIGPFHVVSEESVSAGVRRITALTGRAALVHQFDQDDALAEAAGALKIPTSELGRRIGALVQEVRDLKKQLASGKKAAAGATPDELLRDAETVGAAKVIVAEIPGGNANQLREQIDLLRRKTQPLAALLASRDGDKVLLVAGITRDLEQRGISAVDWVKAASALVGGGGGGRPDMAQAGGKDPEKLPAALEAARGKARELFGS